MKKIARNLLCVAVLASPVSGFSDTLTEIFDLALENDPQLRAAHAAYMAGKESRNIGRAGLLPRVSGSAEYAEADSDHYSRKGLGLDGLQAHSGTRGS